MSTDMLFLKSAVKGAYDLQMLRMQAGLRLCANFRSKLGLGEKKKDDADPYEAEEDEEVIAILDRVKASFRRLTDGIAKHRTIPSKEEFKGDELISEYAEIVLVKQYLELEKQERGAFAALPVLLEDYPIYSDYLADLTGIGPAMAGVLMTGFDVHNAPYPSSFWKYAGLDVVVNENGIGEGRCRREAHLVDREYIDRHGKRATRKSLTYNPWLKSKLIGVLASSFMRLNAQPWKKIYDDYKHRLESDPHRVKVTVVQWRKQREAGEDTLGLWTPGRINNAAKRYMIKMFLIELHSVWRKLEGLPASVPYHEAKLGIVHRSPRLPRDGYPRPAA